MQRTAERESAHDSLEIYLCALFLQCNNKFSLSWFFIFVAFDVLPSSVMCFNLFYFIFTTLNVHLEMIDGDFQQEIARMFPFQVLRFHRRWCFLFVVNYTSWPHQMLIRSFMILWSVRCLAVIIRHVSFELFNVNVKRLNYNNENKFHAS